MESKQRSKECLCAALRRANRAVTRLYDTVLAPTGLKATQFITLQVIYEHGEIAQWRLSQDNAIAVETLSRRLRTLERKGWISHVVRGKNQEHVYRLTPAGVAALKEARGYWTRAQQRLELLMGAEDSAETLRLADNIVNASRRALELRLPNAQPTTPRSSADKVA